VTAQTPQRPETRRQICNAYFTFLSNDENKKPLRLAPVIPETYAGWSTGNAMGVQPPWP
jgi:hypothetical protein